jgi:hypothetical protein
MPGRLPRTLQPSHTEHHRTTPHLRSPYGALIPKDITSDLSRPRNSQSALQIPRKMDFTATLTAAEIEVLSNHDTRALQDAALDFENTTSTSLNNNESAFEKSLRIKNTIDVFEGISRTAASGHALAILMNCEYQLWRLNADTPLQNNPFLSHWVEAIQRLDKAKKREKRTSAAQEDVSTENINAARVLWIKTMLQGGDMTLWLRYAPWEISSLLWRSGLQEPFDLQVYIQMLEEEGIYEKTPEPELSASVSSAREASDRINDGPMTKKKTEPSLEESIQKQKDDIFRNLKQQPETAIFDITRLPITLTHLDFLTTILTDRVLEKHSIDPAPVITQYIQHALRTVERMDKPPSPSADATSEWSEDMRMESEPLEYGKEAQSRCIQLLLLFIKSLIRKGLIELDVLFYEIAEITVRYVWIKEVREFRTWAEEGFEDGTG